MKMLLLSILTLVNFSFAKERKSLSENHKLEVIKVLKANEKVHESFFKYDGSSVESSAKNLGEQIDLLENNEIKKLLNFAKKKALEIKSANDQKTNNQNYNIVSMALIHIVNTYDLGKDYNAYSCPMVKKKWLQNSSKKDKVHNPYSAMMPHCGSKDTNY